MRVLVTGAAGFIGAPVVRRLLADDHDVFGVVRETTPLDRLQDVVDRVRLVRVDLRDGARVRATVAEIRPACAIHLAWYAVPGKYWTAPENRACVEMTLDLARALTEGGCRRLVAAGSCAEYDWSGGRLSEATTPCAPRTPYGAAKHAARLRLESMCLEKGLSFTWARFFHLFGPGEPSSRLVPSVVRALLRGETARCTQGEQIRDFLHVEETAAAVCTLAASAVTGPVNIGSGRSVKIRAVVETIARMLGRPGAVAFGALPTDPADPPVLTADVRRLQEEVGWRPARTLEEGLERTCAWWRAQEGLL